MPTTAPRWFDSNFFMQQKVLQHNVTNPSDPWAGVEQYQAALQAAAPGATAWDNWFDAKSEADNVSPNPLFDEAYYFTALAAASNAAKTNGVDTWTATTIKDYLTSTYHISGWQHYQAQGCLDGLDPSAKFDTDLYIQNRVEQLNAYDNGKGWDGKTDWTVAGYKQILVDAGINPIEDLYLNTDYPANQKIFDVQSPLAPEEGWTPWGTGGDVPPAPPAWEAGETIALTPATDDKVVGQDGVNTLFTATVQVNTPYNTLQSTDQIDGGADSENHLKVIMESNFERGFGTHVNEEGDTVSNLQNVQQIDLVNPDNQQYMFDAKNTESVKVWNLDNTANQIGSLGLFDLPKTGITVALHGQKQGIARIGFDDAVVKGTNDALTILLDNVGTTDSPIDLNTRAVENLTLISDGAKNFVDISKFSDAQNVTITGDADITIKPIAPRVNSIPAGVRVIDGGSATGDIALVSQDVYSMATIRGGSGNDSLTLNGSKVLNYRLSMDDVETLNINEPTDNFIYDASNTTGLEVLNVNTTDTKSFSFLWSNQSKLEANIDSTTDGTDAVTINGVTDLTTNLFGAYDKDFTAVDGTQNLVLNYGKVGGAEADVFAGTATVTTSAVKVEVNLDGEADTKFDDGATITADKATSLVFNTGDESQFGAGTSATGIVVDAALATSLTINTGTVIDDQTAEPHNSSAFYLKTGSNLAAVNNIDINGWGTVELDDYAELGSAAKNLEVDAGGFDGELKAEFAGSAASKSITVTGSATGTNTIEIGTASSGFYSEGIEINGSTGDDTITINITADVLNNLADTGRLEMWLDGGTNTVTFATGGQQANVDQDAVRACIHGSFTDITTQVTFS